ncbi:class I SAM-dependent methyltransferase [Wenzhouxiangella sp. XN24]|uniref:class I SAM-dependent methyltransferase n=1 Tax=Wenzhouxiangella sp. XN24 TaxID=2713569 RepID=UPI001F0EF11B|nr:class I SAM-dependent methyltransferase [Wenzhouxiangella sp. XN24]
MAAKSDGKKDGKKKKNKRKQRGKGTAAPARVQMADLADRHELYEASVQSVRHEVEFLASAFKELVGRKPVTLREDFCGTAAAACEWVRSHRQREAVAVDIDPAVLEWGRTHHVAALKAGQRARVRLIEGDVRETGTEPVDIAVAFNFSWWTFKTREELLVYFRSAYDSLADDGLFVLDIYGGSDAYAEQEEETDYGLFTYVWDQHAFDPVSARYICYIHFRFPDGSELPRAYSYDWRLWTLPEVRELLAEAGFSSSVVYWQGEDEDGEPSGEFSIVERGDADPAWIAYVAACKGPAKG